MSTNINQDYECLSEFLDYNRPLVMDMYIIFRAVIDVSCNHASPDDLVFHIEQIYYCRNLQKVHFAIRDGYGRDAGCQVQQLIQQLKSAVRYAGKDINDFMDSIEAAYSSEDAAVSCLRMLDVYRNEIDALENRFSGFNFLYVSIVVIFEIIMCILMDIKFYS